MSGFSGHTLAFVFGLLANIISFCVFLSPLATFYQIYKKKSTDGFQSIPYVVALFSAMLLMYYAFLKTDGGMLLITINSFGCLIESFYIGVYFYYASKKLKVETIKITSLMIGLYGLILGVTYFLVAVPMRVRIVGWICLVFSLCVFAAPLCILEEVLKTKSVEFMPFPLSFTLTINAVTWFFYGFLINDYNIAIPNILGFAFGLFQMGLYMRYRKPKKQDSRDENVGEVIEAQHILLESSGNGMLYDPEAQSTITNNNARMVDMSKMCAMIEVPQVVSPPPCPPPVNTGDFIVQNRNREVFVAA